MDHSPHLFPVSMRQDSYCSLCAYVGATVSGLKREMDAEREQEREREGRSDEWSESSFSP